MSEPKNHHYLPRFYLSRWAGEDGKVCCYKKPHGPAVKTKRVVPTGTGFEPGLYKVRDERPEFENAMEKHFFSRIDDAAAKSLCLIEQGIQNHAWTDEPRSSWTRFLLAQMFRAPEDVAQVKHSSSALSAQERAQFRPQYNPMRKDPDPPTVDEYIKRLPPRAIDHGAFSIIRSHVTNEPIGAAVNNMVWFAFKFPDHVPALLTSDRPLWSTLTLSEDDAFMLMPVGPRLLFVAAKNELTMIRLYSRDRASLADAVNLNVTRHAVKVVYGLDAGQIDFVGKNMGTRRHSTVSERLAAMQGLPIADPHCPLPQNKGTQAAGTRERGGTEESGGPVGHTARAATADAHTSARSETSLLSCLATSTTDPTSGQTWDLSLDVLPKGGLTLRTGGRTGALLPDLVVQCLRSERRVEDTATLLVGAAEQLLGIPLPSAVRSVVFGYVNAWVQENSPHAMNPELVDAYPPKRS